MGSERQIVIIIVVVIIVVVIIVVVIVAVPRPDEWRVGELVGWVSGLGTLSLGGATPSRIGSPGLAQPTRCRKGGPGRGLLEGAVTQRASAVRSP